MQVDNLGKTTVLAICPEYKQVVRGPPDAWRCGVATTWRPKRLATREKKSGPGGPLD
jgi:hypothetical protein